jgi:hypothetical protein
MAEEQLSFQEGPNATEGAKDRLGRNWCRKPAGEAGSHWRHLTARMLSFLVSDI